MTFSIKNMINHFGSSKPILKINFLFVSAKLFNILVESCQITWPFNQSPIQFDIVHSRFDSFQETDHRFNSATYQIPISTIGPSLMLTYRNFNKQLYKSSRRLKNLPFSSQWFQRLLPSKRATQYIERSSLKFI